MTQVAMQRTSSANAARMGAQELIHALLNPHPDSPLLPLRDEHIAALKRLVEIFDIAEYIPPGNAQALRVPTPIPQ